VIVFYPLTILEIEEIVDIIMKRIEANASENNITIRLTSKAKEYLARKGYNPDFGARPLHRIIEKEVEDPIAIKILEGEFKEGSTIIVDYNSTLDSIVFEREKDRVGSK
jgi:ATP-dependent Clp protease ATP-binding subunit ClpC